jgi:sec-independent protein translocase protein TatA
MTPSIWQIAIVLVLVVLLFGRGKISGLMGDLAKGIKSFKRGMAEEEKIVASTIDGKADAASEPVATETIASKDKAATN